MLYSLSRVLDRTPLLYQLPFVRHLRCPSHSIRCDRTREEKRGEKSTELKVTLFFLFSGPKYTKRKEWIMFSRALWHNNKRTVRSVAWLTFSSPDTQLHFFFFFCEIYCTAVPTSFSLSLRRHCPKPWRWGGTVSLPQSLSRVFLLNMYQKVFIYSAHGYSTTPYLEVTHKRIMRSSKQCFCEMDYIWLAGIS